MSKAPHKVSGCLYSTASSDMVQLTRYQPVGRAVRALAGATHFAQALVFAPQLG